jgi:hypothetical protein
MPAKPGPHLRTAGTWDTASTIDAPAPGIAHHQLVWSLHPPAKRRGRDRALPAGCDAGGISGMRAIIARQYLRRPSGRQGAARIPTATRRDDIRAAAWRTAKARSLLCAAPRASPPPGMW